MDPSNSGYNHCHKYSFYRYKYGIPTQSFHSL